MAEPLIPHRKVTLPSTGIEVYLRKVSSSQLTLATSRAVMSSDLFIAVAAQHSKEGSDELKVYDTADDQRRPPNLVTTELENNPSEMLDFVMETNRAQIAASVFRPRFEELLTMYESKREDIDFGLGEDFDFLLNEIKIFNRPGGLKTEGEVETFPIGGGDDFVLSGQVTKDKAVSTRRAK